MDLLRKDAADPNSSRDFGKDIIPGIVKDGKAVAHRFAKSCVRSSHEAEPYWRDVGTIDAYWEANIDLTDITPELDLYDRDWPIWTYAELKPPAKFVHDEEGRRGQAVSSLVSGDCIVSGASLKRSLIFTGARINSYATLDHVVMLPDCTVGRNAQLTNVVIDHGVKIPEGLVVGEDPALDAKRFRVTEKGICLITQPMIDRLG
jgi:glucose-1-phosphate adenylyltransferase